MDTDREFEHMMMSVRNSSGSITQMVYAANMLQIKLVQFVARLTYKGYLSIKSRDDLASFAKLSEGKYTIYSSKPLSLSCRAYQEKTKRSRYRMTSVF